MNDLNLIELKKMIRRDLLKASTLSEIVNFEKFYIPYRIELRYLTTLEKLDL